MKPEYLENWPTAFYELTDSDLRERCLDAYLEKHPESPSDLRRQEIFYHRYYQTAEKKDNYYYGWSMLKVASQQSTFLNKRHREKEIREYFIDLGVLSSHMDAYQLHEWENFAKSFIEDALKGSSYGTALLGLSKVSDHDKAFRIANDIHTITYTLAREIYLEKEAEPLKKIMEKEFAQSVEDGEEILKLVH